MHIFDYCISETETAWVLFILRDQGNDTNSAILFSLWALSMKHHKSLIYFHSPNTVVFWNVNIVKTWEHKYSQFSRKWGKQINVIAHKYYK